MTLVRGSPGLLPLPAFLFVFFPAFLSISPPLGLVQFGFVVVYVRLGALGGFLAGARIRPLAQCWRRRVAGVAAARNWDGGAGCWHAGCVI